MEPHIIQVAAGLLFHAGRLLITQRRPQDHLGGLWEFPGGKLEPGESFETCLVRELREELAIEVRVGPEISDITHPYPEKTVRLKFFRCELLSGIARPLHVQAVAWVTLDELGLYPFPAADAQVLRSLVTTPDLWRISDEKETFRSQHL